MENRNLNISKKQNKYYFACGARKINNQVQVAFLFPYANCREDAMKKSKRYLALSKFICEKISVGDTFNPNKLKHIVREQLIEHKSFSGYLLEGLVAFSDTDINTALRVSCKEWDTNILITPNEEERTF